MKDGDLAGMVSFAAACTRCEEVVLDMGRPQDDPSACPGTAADRPATEGRHCRQPLGRDATRPPGPRRS
jgi:hypothetical protein